VALYLALPTVVLLALPEAMTIGTGDAQRQQSVVVFLTAIIVVWALLLAYVSKRLNRDGRIVLNFLAFRRLFPRAVLLDGEAVVLEHHDGSAERIPTASLLGIFPHPLWDAQPGVHILAFKDPRLRRRYVRIAEGVSIGLRRRLNIP
jgi:hypothetical protein